MALRDGKYTGHKCCHVEKSPLHNEKRNIRGSLITVMYSEGLATISRHHARPHWRSIGADQIKSRVLYVQYYLPRHGTPQGDTSMAASQGNLRKSLQQCVWAAASGGGRRGTQGCDAKVEDGGDGVHMLRGRSSRCWWGPDGAENGRYRPHVVGVTVMPFDSGAAEVYRAILMKYLSPRFAVVCPRISQRARSGSLGVPFLCARHDPLYIYFSVPSHPTSIHPRPFHTQNKPCQP